MSLCLLVYIAGIMFYLTLVSHVIFSFSTSISIHYFTHLVHSGFAGSGGFYLEWLLGESLFQYLKLR